MELTGSSYSGETRYGRLEGQGIYQFPTGTKYIGSFCDGSFHGEGVLHFPNGGKYVGKWVHGKVTEGKYIFPDQLEYKDSWDYCDGYDRRFHREILEGLNSSGHIRLTNLEPHKEIPEGCYDCGDGFYKPIEHVVLDYNLDYLRYADEDESEWIINKCRKQKDEYITCKRDG